MYSFFCSQASILNESSKSKANFCFMSILTLLHFSSIVLMLFYLPTLMHFSGEENGNPLQCSCLENPMDGGPCWAAIHGVAKSQTRLNDFTWTFHFHALEKEMATHSSVLAWRVPGTGAPGGLPSLGSQSRTRLK